jgi:hypothetical protein
VSVQLTRRALLISRLALLSLTLLLHFLLALSVVNLGASAAQSDDPATLRLNPHLQISARPRQLQHTSASPPHLFISGVGSKLVARV